jgi:hypothetical protein
MSGARFVHQGRAVSVSQTREALLGRHLSEASVAASVRCYEVHCARGGRALPSGDGGPRRPPRSITAAARRFPRLLRCGPARGRLHAATCGSGAALHGRPSPPAWPSAGAGFRDRSGGGAHRSRNTRPDHARAERQAAQRRAAGSGPPGAQHSHGHACPAPSVLRAASGSGICRERVPDRAARCWCKGRSSQWTKATGPAAR